MIGAVGPVGPGRIEAPIPSPPAAPAGAVSGERSFKEILQESIGSVNRLQQEADRVLMKVARGEASQAELATAFRKAQIAFEALLQIRAQLVGAFEEIQRMRV
jgi:flagellar hook-basal body complex protein FliE